MQIYQKWEPGGYDNNICVTVKSAQLQYVTSKLEGTPWTENMSNKSSSFLQSAVFLLLLCELQTLSDPDVTMSATGCWIVRENRFYPGVPTLHEAVVELSSWQFTGLVAHINILR